MSTLNMDGFELCIYPITSCNEQNLCRFETLAKLQSTLVNIEDVKHEPSISDFQNVEHETSTCNSQDVEQISTCESQVVKEQTSINNSQDVEHKTLICDFKNHKSEMSNVLTSLYGPNKYLIVEDVQKNIQNYSTSLEKDRNSNNFYPSKKSESNIFANYQEESVEEKKERKERKEKAKTEYFHKLTINRTETDDYKTIYHLKQFQCLLCHKNLMASFSIFEKSKTLMIDEIKNDYLFPYQLQGVAGLVHRKCKLLRNLNYDDNDQYRCNLSYEEEMKEPMTTQYQLYIMIIILALIVFPMFLSFLIYNLPNIRIFQYETWTIIVYCVLFIVLAINELLRYYKRMREIVQTMYLVVWNV